MWIAVAAVCGALAVIFGAFGAHGLRGRVAPEELAIWSTAAHYQLLHSLVLLALGLWSNATQRSVGVSAGLFVAGIVLFSGSLYVLVLSGVRWLGAVTPIGGLCLIAGWLSLLWLARG